MKDLGNVVTIIPAKGTSNRIQRKNISLLAGKPLISYTIECAKASGLCGEIMVSTEDQEIKKIAKVYRNKDIINTHVNEIMQLINKIDNA